MHHCNVYVVRPWWDVIHNSKTNLIAKLPDQLNKMCINRNSKLNLKTPRNHAYFRIQKEEEKKKLSKGLTKQIFIKQCFIKFKFLSVPSRIGRSCFIKAFFPPSNNACYTLSNQLVSKAKQGIEFSKVKTIEQLVGMF